MCKKLMLLISFVMFIALFSATSVQAVDPNAPIKIWREAESADVLTAPMETYTDDVLASGGKYIGVALGNNSNSASPAPAGTASYIFQVTKAGTYKVAVRVKLKTDTIDDDSSYVRIAGATLNSDVSTLVGGWIKWNNVSTKVNGTGWAWVQVFNNNDSDKNTTFTMDPNMYTLEIAYREDGMYFDGILITNDPNLDVATLPATVPACVETNLLVNGGFENGYVGNWGFDNDNPVVETHQIVGDAQDGYNGLKITVLAKGSNDYVPAFRYNNISFEAGKKYTFSVFLKGSVAGMQITLKPEMTGGSYTGYGQVNKILTTEWAEYSTTTPVFSSTVTPADLSIWIGHQVGEIYVDHARFYEGAYVLPCPAVVPAVMSAVNPSPADGTTGLKRQVMLSWEAGDEAGTHNVYIGTDKLAVTNATVANPLGVLVSKDQNDVFYNFTSGEYGTTYYWRVDEVNATEGKSWLGTIWSFSTKPIGQILPQASISVTVSGSKDAAQDPNNLINGSGLNAQNQHGTANNTMWLSSTPVEPNKTWVQFNFDRVYKIPRMLVWNYNTSGMTAGYGFKGVAIEYSADGGQTWTTWADCNELPKGEGKNTYLPVKIDLGGVANGIVANAIRITALSNWTSSLKQQGLSEVKFYSLTPWPTNPNPADDANNVTYNKPKLTWKAGDCVVKHKVYFGLDELAVINGTASSTTIDVNNWTTPELVLGKTYFWRVEEVNMAATPSVWSGDTWSFKVQDYITFDNLDSYTSSTLTNTWKLLSGSPGSLAVEPNIVHSGKSIKFSFNNTTLVKLSEITRTTPSYAPWNWKSGSPKWLVFWIYGNVSNPNTEKLYVKINSTYYYFSDGWNIISKPAIDSPSWTQVAVPLQADTTSTGSVTALGIGLYRDIETGNKGFIYIDDIRLYNTLP